MQQQLLQSVLAVLPCDHTCHQGAPERDSACSDSEIRSPLLPESVCQIYRLHLDLPSTWFKDSHAAAFCQPP